MQRDELARLLAAPSEAVRAARTALEAGARYVVWDGPTSAEALARIYERRLRHTRRSGQHTLGLDETVRQLRHSDQPVLLGQIDSGSWTFMVFVAPDGQSLVACTAVERRSNG